MGDFINFNFQTFFFYFEYYILISGNSFLLSDCSVLKLPDHFSWVQCLSLSLQVLILISYKFSSTPFIVSVSSEYPSLFSFIFCFDFSILFWKYCVHIQGFLTDIYHSKLTGKYSSLYVWLPQISIYIGLFLCQLAFFSSREESSSLPSGI